MPAAICGRTVTLVGNGDSGMPTDLVDAYRALGTEVLGFVTSTDSSTVASELADGLAADQIPALTVTGTATDLFLNSPTVVGPTADIMAINAPTRRFRPARCGRGHGRRRQRRIGESINALDGMRWYGEPAHLTVATQPGSALVRPADAACCARCCSRSATRR